MGHAVVWQTGGEQSGPRSGTPRTTCGTWPARSTRRAIDEFHGPVLLCHASVLSYDVAERNRTISILFISETRKSNPIRCQIANRNWLPRYGCRNVWMDEVNSNCDRKKLRQRSSRDLPSKQNKTKQKKELVISPATVRPDFGKKAASAGQDARWQWQRNATRYGPAGDRPGEGSPASMSVRSLAWQIWLDFNCAY